MPTPNAPHRGANFEGFFTKFDLASGATLIIVMCSIANINDPRRRNNITVTYRHPDAGRSWQRVLWPHTAIINTFDKEPTSRSNAEAWNLSFWDAEGALVAAMGSNFGDLTESLKLSLIWPIIADGTHTDRTRDGTMFFINDSGSDHKPLRFAAYTKSRTAWNKGSPSSSPEGLLGLLPLPLHWHVHSLCSHMTLAISPGFDDVGKDSEEMKEVPEKQEAIAHEEKNWANGFPSAHMWVQARDDQESQSAGLRSVCLAGGRIMGVDAFLVGYRNDARRIRVDFRPPSAMSVLGISPLMTVERDWQARRLVLQVSSWRYRLRVEAQAPPDSFFHLAAPQPGGFLDDAMAQSAAASITVKVWRRSFPGLSWHHVVTDSFSKGSLEFGGDYYPERPSPNNA